MPKNSQSVDMLNSIDGSIQHDGQPSEEYMSEFAEYSQSGTTALIGYDDMDRSGIYAENDYERHMRRYYEEMPHGEYNVVVGPGGQLDA